MTHCPYEKINDFNTKINDFLHLTPAKKKKKNYNYKQYFNTYKNIH